MTTPFPFSPAHRFVGGTLPILVAAIVGAATFGALAALKTKPPDPAKPGFRIPEKTPPRLVTFPTRPDKE